MIRPDPFRRTEATEPGFSGWIVAGCAAVAMAMTAPGQTIGISVFVDHLIVDLELSRSSVSAAYLIGTLASASTMAGVGGWIDRAGVRRTMLIVGAGFGLALIATSQVTGLVSLVLGFFLLRFLGQGCLMLIASTAVALWFDRLRGTVVGTTMAVGSAGMALTPLAFNTSIDAVGWRLTWVATGVVIWMVVLPLAVWGMHDSPAALGQLPDGRPPPEPDDHDVEVLAPSWTRGEAVRTPMFWLLVAGVAVISMLATGLMFHQISILGERGLTPAQAAGVFIPQTGAVVAMSILVGRSIDRLAVRVIVPFAMGMLGAALVLASAAGPGPSVIAYALAVGGAGGAMRALDGAMFPRIYGIDHIGAIRGIVFTATVAGSAIGPLLLGAGYDLFGSYRQVLLGSLVLPASVALWSLLVPEPSVPTDVTGPRRNV